MHRLILNINSLRNRFASLSTIIKDKSDIFIRNYRFYIDDCIIYSHDRNECGDDLRDDIPSTLLKIDSKFEAFYVELNTRKMKSLSCSS